MLLDNPKDVMVQVPVESLFPEAKKLKMYCPFHKEKTPSFVIYEKEGRCHCYGQCNKGWSYADYVIKMGYAADFKEAMNYLRRLAGLPVVESANPLRKKIFEINRKAAEFFTKKLSESREAQEYLRGRRITQEERQSFKIGYAPAGNQLSKHLLSLGYSKEDIKLAGLAYIDVATKALGDFFKNRIMFPVFFGEYVYGFSGRVIGVVDKSVPKYKNTTDTPVFHKGKLFYGFYPQGIKSFGYAIVDEGQLDTISMHRIGFNNTTGPMGTALTPSHAKELKKYTDNVILLFDGDPAGEKAALRSVNICLDAGLRVKVGILPAGEDPDSLIGKSGEDRIAEIVDAAEMAEVFLLRKNKSERLSIITRLATSQNIHESVLPYLQGVEKTVMQELSSKTIMELLRETGKVLYRSRGLEIRRWFGLLIVYLDNEYLFWQKESGDVYKQAYAIAKVVRRNVHRQ